MKKNNISIEQLSLLKEKTSSNLNLEGSSPVSSSYNKIQPNTTLITGLNKTDLKSEGMYIIRSLVHYYSRGLNSHNIRKNFLKTLQNEIDIKQGKVPLELAVMNALIIRNFS